jgi:hypothetical protein
MEALFAASLGSSTPRQAARPTLAHRRERLFSELPALAQGASREAA